MTDLDKLKDIGAHKIYEQTHIAKKFVQDILDKNFSSMSKMQFSGFIKILEREYSLDLNELMLEFGIAPVEEKEIKREPFMVSAVEKKSSSSKIIIFIVAIVLLVVAGYFIISNLSTEVKQDSNTSATQVVVEEPNTIVENAKQNLNNLDKKEEIAKVEVEEEVTVEPVHTTNFTVQPTHKIWIGIVDLSNFKRSQKLTNKPFDLDADKEWLLVTGHSYLDFDVNGEEKNYSDKNKAWFAYENGTLTKISREMFKEKNRGRAW